MPTDQASRPRVLTPGLPTPGPGTERYLVRGNSATALSLEAGDVIELINLAGLQACELVAFDDQGRSDPGLLGATNDGPATGTQAILGDRLTDARRVRAGLAVAGIELADAVKSNAFDAQSSAGERRSYTASVAVTAVVAAVGADMDTHGQNTSTDILVFVHRARQPQAGEVVLPVPLADMTQDIFVERQTAQAYQVKAGEFIQIIDIEGRECSDFQAFDARALDGSLEQCLDATVTRSLMGAAYPGPGLFSKFYDVTMAPLIEVVQDTVGRHDTFNLACTAKYYDEMGYPGHVNCTDNMNWALDPYGVAPRMGWEAINFFYNTNMDEANQIFLDEPWSRPGDYVLLRALTDLVCVSTALFEGYKAKPPLPKRPSKSDQTGLATSKISGFCLGRADRQVCQQ